jgi:hypothetical protein
VLGGCASGTPEPAWGTDERGRPDSQITVRVQNRQFSEVTLWAVSDGGRLRMGTVNSMGTEVVRVPWSGLRPLQVEINLLQGERFLTSPVNVPEGEQVTLVIESVLRESQLYRR